MILHGFASSLFAPQKPLISQNIRVFSGFSAFTTLFDMTTVSYNTFLPPL